MKMINIIVFEKMNGRNCFFYRNIGLGGSVNQLIKNKRPQVLYNNTYAILNAVIISVHCMNIRQSQTLSVQG